MRVVRLGAVASFVVASAASSIAVGQEPAPAPPPASPPALEYTLAPGGIRITDASGARDLPLGDCEPKAIAREGNRVFVACGAAGIVVLDATDPRNPAIVMRAATEGDAVGLHTVEGKVWVEIAHVEARPAAAVLRAARAASGAAPGSAPAPTVPASAEPSAPARVSLVAPPRLGELWELDLRTRAFLPIGNIGFGLLGAASLAYRFRAPVAVYAELAPVGIAGGKQGTIGTGGGHGLVALDTQFFELGLGFGAVTLNSPSNESTSSLSFAQKARFGARDGLAFYYFSNVIVDNDKFEIGSLGGSLQVAVNPRWWLLFGGGGGPVGFAQGDLGLRYLVHGDRGPGSLFLTGTIGGAAVFKTTKTPTTFPNGSGTFTSFSKKSADYAGPAFGVGLEWRL